MGVIAEGILRGCQGLFTPVSLGYPLSVFYKTLLSKKERKVTSSGIELRLIIFFRFFVYKLFSCFHNS